jgi:hypothetical protein
MVRSGSGFFAVAVSSLVALCLVGLAAPASAQYGPQLELTALYGYFIAQDLYTVTSASGAGTTIGLENSGMYGGRIGLYPKPYGGIEFAYTRTGSDVKVNNAYNGYVANDLGRMEYDNYDINFVARQQNMGNPRVQGFGTIGLGWTVTHPEVTTAQGTSYSGNTLFGINFGLGANIAMNPKLGLRLEGRWKITDTNISTGAYTYCDYWGYCYSYPSSSYSSGELSAGLTYKLGAK